MHVLDQIGRVTGGTDHDLHVMAIEQIEMLLEHIGGQVGREVDGERSDPRARMSVAMGVEVSPDLAEPAVELLERAHIVPWQAADQTCLTSFADQRWAADEKHRRTDGGQRQSLTNV